ncbi:hypothetical protein BKA01_003064 [Pseudonocardia eucalypti]|uniref:hypothetical protein n=1 Tax=Pseudonocardia eucalypti TaxID=648755 RepID=UPI0016136B75|nr:hypothetical protein [Pseudonocardia eucalypti]
MIDMNEPIHTRELPTVMTGYPLTRHARDLATPLARRAKDTDTTELVAHPAACQRALRGVHHPDGDFPGDVVDPPFQFTPRGGHVAEPVIEP